MYVCVYVYACVCVCMCMRAYVCVCVCVRMCVYVYACVLCMVHLKVWSHFDRHLWLHMHVCLYVCMFLSVLSFMCVISRQVFNIKWFWTLCIHIHTHTHIHTQVLLSALSLVKIYGQNPIQSSGGIATFTDLSITHPGFFSVIRFGCPGLTPGFTNPFAVGPSAPLSSCPGARGSIARCGPKEGSVMHLRIMQQPLHGFGGEVLGVLAARLMYVDGEPIEGTGAVHALCMYIYIYIYACIYIYIY